MVEERSGMVNLELAPPKNPVGLYLHFPYCRQLCHYCDFAKTANFQADHLSRYLKKLKEHFLWWQSLQSWKFDTVFVGGGTPSLIDRQWQSLFELIAPNLVPGAEITLEANPDDVTTESLTVWRDLGVNRLSLGIQTFDPRGLQLMQRIHTTDTARVSLEKVSGVFTNWSADLIYGWPGQTPEDFQSDMNTLLEFRPPHISYYNLTYEPRTPIGRAALRGKLRPTDDDHLERMFCLGTDLVQQRGYRQDEVSNVSLGEAWSRHNSRYWRHDYYLGIGAGACGFLPGGRYGVRYATNRSDRVFISDREWQEQPNQIYEFETDRDGKRWAIEVIATGLRSRFGVDLKRISSVVPFDLKPTPVLAEGLENGMVSIKDEMLYLSPGEWFREQSWALEVLDSLAFT